jgi:hypothetical protein
MTYREMLGDELAFRPPATLGRFGIFVEDEVEKVAP